MAGTSSSADEDAAVGAWQERIARYISVGNGHRDDKDGEEGGRPTEAEQRSDQQADEKHLLFVSTSRGYALVERDGPPPAPFRDVTVPGHDGLFRVVKVATSPLPNDRRVCAYLQQSEV